MTDEPKPSGDEPTIQDAMGASDRDDRQYHPWRLLAVLVGVLVILGGIAAAINVAVLGW